MFGSSKLQDCRFYVRVSFEVIKKFAPAINSVKNVVRQTLGRVPNCTANCKILGFIFVLSMRVYRICTSSKFCEKRNITNLRASGKLYCPNLTAVDYSLLRVRESVPIFSPLLRHIPQAWAI